MNNLFCITKEKLIKIFWGYKTEERLFDLISKFGNKFSSSEIIEQMKTGDGEVGRYFFEESDKFADDTANNEIANAITLADFYFPNSKSSICFEMKNDFKQESIDTIDELIDNLEQNTEIDCLIKDGNTEFKFQLKQYPEKYKKWNIDKVKKYIDEDILKKYNHKGNEDLIIIITIRPELITGFKEVEHFDILYEYLALKEIILKEIDFIYNRNNQDMVWFQVFPEEGHSKISFNELSYHKAKD